MAKKEKKKRDINLSPAQMVQPGMNVNEEIAVQAVETPTSQPESLEEEYRYVIADLKRIGIIAAAMLALLIVLALTLT